MFTQRIIDRRKKKKWNYCRNKIFSSKRKLMTFNCVCDKSNWNWTESNFLHMTNLIFNKSMRKSWRNWNSYLNLILRHQNNQNKLNNKLSPSVNLFQKRKKWQNSETFFRSMVWEVKKHSSCLSIMWINFFKMWWEIEKNITLWNVLVN